MSRLTGVQWLALQLDVAVRMIAELREISIAAARAHVERAAEVEAEARAELAEKPEGER